MSKPILVRGARQLLTLRGPSGPRRGADLRNLGIIQDGAVLIVNGIVREVGTARRIENLAESRTAEELNANRCVVLPGFVDSHTHLVGGPSRLIDYEMNLAGATDDQITNAGGGIPGIFEVIQKVSMHTLQAQAARVLEDCVRHGTTTIESKSGFGINETGEIKILRAQTGLNERFGNVVSTFMASRFMPKSYENRAPEYIEWLCSYLLPLVRRRKLAIFADIPCEEDSFSAEEAYRYLVAARELGFRLKMHAGEHWNIGAIRVAVELEITSVDHAIHINADDIAALARVPTIVTLLPGPVFFLGSQRYAPARVLIDEGCAVALATNYNSQTSPSHNMQMALSLACRNMHMTPAEAISAATINGAHALGISSKVGSIEFGKDANLIILDVPDYRELPYHFGVNLVATTMFKGRVIYRASGVEWPSN